MNARSRCVVAVSLLLVLAFIAGCGGPGSASTANEVKMNAAEFEQTSITIKAGTALLLVDEQSGTTHLLCLGTDGQCDPNAAGPTQLHDSPLQIDPGQTIVITFETPGNYNITCTIHPGMELTVTVQ